MGAATNQAAEEGYRLVRNQLGAEAEGLAATRAKAVGAVSQATGQLHGALEGVDAVETMFADVQGGTAVLA
jgi:hypothetical protein